MRGFLATTTCLLLFFGAIGAAQARCLGTAKNLIVGLRSSQVLSTAAVQSAAPHSHRHVCSRSSGGCLPATLSL